MSITSPPTLPDFLPGRLTIGRGTARDYGALAPFHYLADRPATFADVWAVRYEPPAGAATGPPVSRALSRALSRPVAVGVLSYPVPSCAGREAFLRRRRRSRRDNLRFANRHVRTISRVIVHPQFRALGLSTALVRCLCHHCDTRYVEAMSRMADAHPLFRRAGMRPLGLGRAARRGGRGAAYFILDRRPARTARPTRPSARRKEHPHAT